MQTVGERGVRQGERAVVVEPRSLPDWEAAHVFLEVARCGSFRSAALKMGQSINALRRKVEELEHSLGTALLTRQVNGVRLTDEGDYIFTAALQMEAASFGIVQARNTFEKEIEGEVRLAVTEGLGTFWLTPRLVEFQRANPRLMINLACAMKSVDVLRLEADISVQLQRPEASDLKVAKLGRMHLVPFASKQYLETYGTPATKEDLVKHRFVVQADSDKSWQSFYDKIFPGVSPIGLVSLRSNVSSAHYWSIAKGAGIGMLPTYGYALGADLVPLNIDVYHSLEIWLTYHPDAKRIARVKRTLGWIIRSFDAKRFPWFRDEFIPPTELAAAYNGPPLVNMFAGYAGRYPRSVALATIQYNRASILACW